MFEFIFGAVDFLKLCRNCIFPHGRTVQELENAYKVTRFLQVLGVLGMVFGIGSYLWALPDAMDSLDPPADIVTVGDLTQDSFVGVFNEALVQSRVQLPDAKFVRQRPVAEDADPLLARLNPPYAFIPLTDESWQSGDPVRVLLTISQLRPNQGPSNAQVFDDLGIAIDQGNTPQVMMLLTPYTVPIDIPFFRASMADAGVALAGDLMIVAPSAPDRDDKIESYRANQNTTGPLFFWLGFGFFGFTWLLRIRLLRYLRLD